MLVHTNLKENINKLVQTCAGEAESSLVHTKFVKVLCAMHVCKNTPFNDYIELNRPLPNCNDVNARQPLSWGTSLLS